MLYQLPLNLSLFLILIDLFLVIWLISCWKWEQWRTLSTIIAFVLFCGLSAFKWIGTSPAFLASTPNELFFKSSDNIGTLYFARQGDEELFIFWEEKINGVEGKLTFEMEGIYPNGLLIFKKNEQNLLEFRPNLELDGNTWEPILVEINDYQFKPISQQGEQAWKGHRKVAWANYTSQVLSLVFLATFLITFFKRESKTS